MQEKCPEIKEHLLLLDGLGSQSTAAFIELALDLNIYPMYFPPNCTHLVQPVDHRVAAWLKRAFHELYKSDEAENYDLWANFRENGSLCPQMLRCTLLTWMSASWKVLRGMESFLLRAFVSTGCLITLKGQH